jgi:hypothetical protein
MEKPTSALLCDRCLGGRLSDYRPTWSQAVDPPQPFLAANGS